MNIGMQKSITIELYKKIKDNSLIFNKKILNRSFTKKEEIVV